MWIYIILIEQYITFWLQEWHQNGLKIVLFIYGTVQSFWLKYEKWPWFETHDTHHYGDSA